MSENDENIGGQCSEAEYQKRMEHAGGILDDLKEIHRRGITVREFVEEKMASDELNLREFK